MSRHSFTPQRNKQCWKLIGLSSFGKPLEFGRGPLRVSLTRGVYLSVVEAGFWVRLSACCCFPQIEWSRELCEDRSRTSEPPLSVWAQAQSLPAPSSSGPNTSTADLHTHTHVILRKYKYNPPESQGGELKPGSITVQVHISHPIYTEPSLEHFHQLHRNICNISLTGASRWCRTITTSYTAIRLPVKQERISSAGNIQQNCSKKTPSTYSTEEHGK